jgi:murein DD-endopeptidase MepM/ murein hydrolase activator NlpD
MQRHPPSRRRTKSDATRKGQAIAFYGVVLLLAGWAGGATLYILFSDDALRILAERQVAQSRAYEGQISALQTEIDRLRSLKLIEQARVDQTLTELARRQSAIESRQAAITALQEKTSPEITGALLTPGGARRKPTPLTDPLSADQRAHLDLRQSFGAAANSATEVWLNNLSRAVALVESRQGAALSTIETRMEDRAQRMRSVLAELGLERPGEGGPFLPPPQPPGDSLAQQLQRISAARTAAAILEAEVDRVPVRQPTAVPAEVISGFGMRLDPFLRQPAMHTGIDLRGETGEEVRAAGGGRVTQAARNGGYGLMVEIDHGNGLASRYAHLSAIDVREGQQIAPGETVGRVGSTGRSTGPHLHFEVRIDGDPADPHRFLRAGLRLHASD